MQKEYNYKSPRNNTLLCIHSSKKTLVFYDHNTYLIYKLFALHIRCTSVSTGNHAA